MKNQNELTIEQFEESGLEMVIHSGLTKDGKKKFITVKLGFTGTMQLGANVLVYKEDTITDSMWDVRKAIMAYNNL